MTKTKTLPSIRITDNTYEQIVLSLNKFNEKSIVDLTLQDYRRLAYSFLASKILSGEAVNIKLER